MHTRILVPLLLFVGALVPSPADAQANQNPGLDVLISKVRLLQVVGRVGSFPTGDNGLSCETTVCNEGTVPVPWMAAMNVNHPMFAFLVARDSNGHFEQISDQSYIKHAIFASNSSGCGPCTIPPGPLGTSLGVGCSDVYDVGINANQMQLGEPEEVDPWLGTWARTCSLFDRGEPAVQPPANCDNQRSLTQNMVNSFDPVHHRVVVHDADLDVPGATFYFQCYFITAGEPEAVRHDSLASRNFSAAWNGTRWDMTEINGTVSGPVVGRWAGASVSSGLNGADDGRVYVAVKVSGPTQGFYHYEFALQNRDNKRGVGAFRLPTCSGARFKDFGFHDVDDDPLDDWSATVGSGEVVFSSASNPLRWNTLYSFWFDCDAAPESGAVALDAFDPGVGSPSFLVSTSVPTGLANAFLGAGCAASTPATLYASGMPPLAQLGNTTFAVESAGNQPGAETVLYYGFTQVPLTLAGCTLWTGMGSHRFSTAIADANGVARHALPIPPDPSVEGLVIDFECLITNPGTGVLVHRYDLSDALRVRVGNLVGGCP